MCFPGSKKLHVDIFVFRFHLAVDNGSYIFRSLEFLNDSHVSGFEVFVIHLLAFLDQRIYHEDLVPLGYLGPHEIKYLAPLAFPCMCCDNRSAARREFVYYAHVEVSVQGHGQCPWNRGCGHDHHMRSKSVIILAPQAASLIHPEAMLFVYYGQTERMEPDPVFYERMGSYDDVYAAFFKFLEDLLPFLRLGASGQKGNPGIRSLEEFGDACKMLVCQYFRRGHYAGLITVVNCNEAEQNGNQGLT